MKEILVKYIQKATELKDAVTPMQKTDDIYPKVRSLVEQMQSEANRANDEILYPTLYNAAATIATAPKSCSVRQLTEALEDAIAEMQMMTEYI